MVCVKIISVVIRAGHYPGSSTELKNRVQLRRDFSISVYSWVKWPVRCTQHKPMTTAITASYTGPSELTVHTSSFEQ